MKLIYLILLASISTLLSYSSNAKSPALPEIPLQDNKVRFAIISDLTGGEREGIFDIAVEGLTALQPDFILSIGDLIDGGLEDTEALNKQWRFFDQGIKKTNIPFYPVVGNHDISNLVMRNWWQENIAPRYYHIRHKDILFLMLDSEDYPDERFSEMAQIRLDGIAVYKKNPADFPDTKYAKLFERKYGQIRNKQTQYFEQALQDNKDVKWTFVLMHKPMWKQTEKTGFAQIETALQGRQYTVLNGHTHTYHYTERFGQDYIQLGTTGGAFTPADDGEYMDHIMMVSINKNDNKPKLLNITLGGMRNKLGKIPANEKKVCSGQQTCTKAPESIQ
jgi:3',5'-cyclic AMP phosphodiesterase CpdA